MYRKVKMAIEDHPRWEDWKAALERMVEAHEKWKQEAARGKDTPSCRQAWLEFEQAKGVYIMIASNL
jgi:hypothetical protein